MEFRYLGNSGLKISEITYGNWLTHGSQVENDVATKCVHAALDEGRTGDARLAAVAGALGARLADADEVEAGGIGRHHGLVDRDPPDAGHPTHKIGVLHTLATRDLRISDKEHLVKEKEHLIKVFLKNGYNKHQTIKAINKANTRHKNNKIFDNTVGKVNLP